MPRLAYVNKLDRTGADFFDCIRQMQEKLGVRPAICALPAGQGADFQGVIDLIRMKFIRRDPTDRTNVRYDLVEIPSPFRKQAGEYRHQLLEAGSHCNDHLIELILEGQDVPEDLLCQALRTGTITGQLTPILCGSSKNFHGVQMLLDAVVDFLPSPLERPAVRGVIYRSKDREETRRHPEVGEPFAALAFKTIAESTGDLVFLRIYSGQLHPKDEVLNASTGRTERVRASTA